MHYYKLRLVLVFLFAFVSLAGDAAAQRTKIKVIFPTAPTPQFLPHFVAKDSGWLQRAGIDVEEVWLNSDANAMRALLAGQADLANVGAFALYSAIAEGGAVKAIASSQPVIDYVLIAREGFDSLSNLAAARIAAASIGGLTSELPRLAMLKNNVDPSRATFFTVGGHDARLQAVLAGKADAALVSPLFAEQGRKFGKLNTVLNLAREFPLLSYSYIAARNGDLRNAEKLKAIEDYVRLAVIEGSRFIMRDPEAAATILEARLGNVDRDLVLSVVKSMVETRAFGVNGGIDLDITEFTVPLAFELKLTSRILKAEEVVDSSAVDKILAEAGRM
jgi:NitT/TauT family transport system substrate-binding protein